MNVAARRMDRETPYRRDFLASEVRNSAKGVRPRGLGQYVTWLLAEWAKEIPDRMHEHSVWRGYAATSETPPAEHLGGSLSGSPAWADPFRRYIENGPRETDPDGFFVRPIHAALADIAGRDPRSREFYWARVLTAIAHSGDWQAVARRLAIPVAVAELAFESMLYRLWSVWRASPDQRVPSHGGDASVR